MSGEGPERSVEPPPDAVFASAAAQEWMVGRIESIERQMKRAIASWESERDALRARAEAAEGRIAAALAIMDGDEGFVVGEPWPTDGSWSKHDRCVHGNWRYDGCAWCLDDALRAALAPREEPPAQDAQGEEG